ncbi:Cysteine/O-acetylserine efflux protein [Polaromonas vacuolata]|uniref:Cysteine/O-acetylserine efflux protein n=1 Tax=Polaromonas vacuolata TaxID=37448 RepID=A0A6H2H5R4_9BURK|nr:LysE family translocator [Polaromonas vacuolata]QJC55190.1 Cysteine/O-acetylserine efflux protein [Polaromonas vacuolata]
MNWQEFTALLVLATAMSFSPGPNTMLSTTLAANHGLRLALPFICSVPVGWGVLLGLCSLGLGALLAAVPILGLSVKLLGIGYLFWLAYRLARKPAAGHHAAKVPANVGFWQGAALQFVNIKAWMMALAIVSGWIAGQSQPLIRFAIVLPVMLCYAFVSNLSYALIGSLLREWLAGPVGTGRRLLIFNRIMALILFVTGIWMLRL